MGRNCYSNLLCRDNHNFNHNYYHYNNLVLAYTIEAVSTTRICSKCSIEKTLATDFYFHRANKCYSRTCNQCKNKERRAYYARRTGKIPKRNREGEILTCPKCNQEKTIDNFYYRKTQDTYNSYCKACVSGVNKGFLKKVGKKRRKIYTIEEQAANLIKRYKKFDIGANKQCSLTRNHVIGELQKPCHYCGLEAGGLDRLDNSLGHTDENCVSCCSLCNFTRADRFTVEEMKLIGRVIAEIRKSR